MAPKWQRSIYWRAFEGARHALGIETGERALIPVVVVVVGFAFVWLSEGWNIAKSQLPIIKSSFVAFIIIFFLMYVLKCLTIPKKSFQIILGRDEPYTTIAPSGANMTRTVRVMLRNNMNSEIPNGKVHLLNLTPPNGEYECFLLKDNITIGPHKNIFIDVASYNEGTSELTIGSWITLIIPRPGVFMPRTFGFLPIRSHTFYLKFSSLGGISDEIYCRIFVDLDHVLKIEEWS